MGRAGAGSRELVEAEWPGILSLCPALSLANCFAISPDCSHGGDRLFWTRYGARKAQVLPRGQTFRSALSTLASRMLPARPDCGA